MNIELERKQRIEAHDLLLRRERRAALGRLTGRLSHELRGQVATIQKSLFSLSEKILDKGLGVDCVLRRLQHSVDRCSALTQELSDFSRVRKLTKELTCIDSWLEEILVERGVPQGVRMRYELEAGVAVAIDRKDLRRAINNLLDNAIHAMVEKSEPQMAGDEPMLTVRSRIVGERLELEVIDTGSGIPDDLLPRVFEPLFSTRTFGTGLGLPAVQQIVEQHGGVVEISSRQGLGTLVEVCLPISTTSGRVRTV